MNQKSVKRLEEFLSSECSDYDLSYTWEWCEDCNCFIVTITQGKDSFEPRIIDVNFKYDKESDDLRVELCEDSYELTREYDETVKYFWMKVSPTLFRNA